MPSRSNSTRNGLLPNEAERETYRVAQLQATASKPRKIDEHNLPQIRTDSSKTKTIHCLDVLHAATTAAAAHKERQSTSLLLAGFKSPLRNMERLEESNTKSAPHEVGSTYA